MKSIATVQYNISLCVHHISHIDPKFNCPSRDCMRNIESDTSKLGENK